MRVGLQMQMWEQGWEHVLEPWEGRTGHTSRVLDPDFGQNKLVLRCCFGLPEVQEHLEDFAGDGSKVQVLERELALELEQEWTPELRHHAMENRMTQVETGWRMWVVDHLDVKLVVGHHIVVVLLHHTCCDTVVDDAAVRSLLNQQ